ncbi:MAG TPA: hypothetical protein VE198_00470 [Actinoallomurus sp.]|nr:hypothetical protein [Actinoallomurus sp.]
MDQYRKFIAAAIAAAGVFASSGLLHGTAQLVLTTVIAAVGAAIVLLVPNAPAAEQLP